MAENKINRRLISGHNRNIVLIFLSVIFLISAFVLVQYFIWGPLYIREFHADTADTLFWANADIENGRPFKPSFDYSYKLLFGGQWFFVPFVKLFGIGMKAQRCAMSLFSVLLTIELVFFFKAMNFSNRLSMVSAAVMLISPCITMKTREIFYGHIIHYSLAVFYLLIAHIFISRIITKKAQAGWFILYTLWLSVSSANGFVNILYVAFPIIFGCLIEFYFYRDKRLAVLAGCTILALFPAMLLTYSGAISTSYTDIYSDLARDINWGEQLMRFPKLWISLFNDYSADEHPIFSAAGIKSMIYTLFGLMSFLILPLSFSHYKNETNQGKRVFYFSAWIMFFLLIFFIMFGKISDANWRLTPLVFTCQILILFQLDDIVENRKEIIINRSITNGLTIVCCMAFILQTITVSLAMLTKKGYDVWFGKDGLLATLREHDLNYGFANYWYSNSITVLSDDEIRSRNVEWEGERPRLQPFNINMDLTWYDDQPDQSKYFLVINESMYDPNNEFFKFAKETYNCFQRDERNKRKEHLNVLVYDYNFMKTEYERVKKLR